MEKDSHTSELNRLFRQKRFFELRDETAKFAGENSPELTFYRGAVANKFNRTDESNALIEEYLKTAKPNGERFCECYELLGDNYAKLYQYDSAAKRFEWLYENCSDQYAGEKRLHLEYLYETWMAARDLPPQTISIAADSHIPAKRLKSQHLEIPVEVNGRDSNFLFDTGANFSCVTVSTAERLNLRIIDCDISVGTSTDIRVNVKLAFAAEMKLGNVELRNVIFMLLKDEDFYLAKHEYQINGIVGYSVIRACRQISVKTTGEIHIPARISGARDAEQNLCFDDMMPLLNVKYKKQPMSFILDTGGHRSQIWNKFFVAYQDDILKRGRLEISDLGGAGGRRSVEAYILDEVPVSVSGKDARFAEARIFSEPLNELWRNFFGNIGQDFIMQFEKMTIDFDFPFVSFE